MTDNLATAAVQIATQGAMKYLEIHNMTANPDALTYCLKSMCKIRLPQALAEAREAQECGMDQIATATFAATMRLAGIEAAKECCMTK